MAQYLETLSRKKTFEPRTFAETNLARRLNKLDLTSLGVAATLGAGIYVVTGVVARNTSGPGIVLSFLIAGVASLLSALCYAEFASRVPKTGSAYIYSYVTIGEFCAFVVGWNLILEYLIGTSSLARGWTEYMDSLLGGRIQNFTSEHIGHMHAPLLAKFPDFLAFFLTLVVTIPLCLGVTVTAKANNVITAVNLIVILFVCIIGFSFAVKENWTNNFLPFGFSGVLAGAATCFFSFVGFDVIATSAEEAINPTRDLPFSMVLTIGKSCWIIIFFTIICVITFNILLLLQVFKYSRNFIYRPPIQRSTSI